MDDSPLDAERTVKDAQIARSPTIPVIVRTSRDGREGWFDHDGKSFHVYLDGRKDRCAAHIWSPLGNGNSVPGRCSHRPTVEYGRFLFCGLHNPPKVVERNAKRAADRRAKYSEQEARWRAGALESAQRAAALEAIKKIAAGHNDPRGLAKEVLAMAPPRPCP